MLQVAPTTASCKVTSKTAWGVQISRLYTMFSKEENDWGNIYRLSPGNERVLFLESILSVRKYTKITRGGNDTVIMLWWMASETQKPKNKEQLWKHTVRKKIIILLLIGTDVCRWVGLVNLIKLWELIHMCFLWGGIYSTWAQWMGKGIAFF